MNTVLPLCCPYKTQTLRNIESDQKAICAQALLVDTIVPPMPHRLPGHELFDLVTKLRIHWRLGKTNLADYFTKYGRA